MSMGEKFVKPDEKFFDTLWREDHNEKYAHQIEEQVPIPSPSKSGFQDRIIKISTKKKFPIEHITQIIEVRRMDDRAIKNLALRTAVLPYSPYGINAITSYMRLQVATFYDNWDPLKTLNKRDRFKISSQLSKIGKSSIIGYFAQYSSYVKHHDELGWVYPLVDNSVDDEQLFEFLKCDGLKQYVTENEKYLFQWLGMSWDQFINGFDLLSTEMN